MYQVTHEIQVLGPLIDCEVGVTREFAAARASEKKSIPKRLAGLRALVDTGADGVAIDTELVVKLGLPLRSAKKSQTIDGERYRFKCEVCIILLFGEDKLAVEVPGWCVDNLTKGSEFDLLIGRNILSVLELHYDGPNNRFTLSHNE